MSERSHIPLRAPPLCACVPPYLLQSIANNEANTDANRAAAQKTLAVASSLHARRAARQSDLCRPRGSRSRVVSAAAAPADPSSLPDALLRQIVDAVGIDTDTRECAKRDLDHIRKVLEASAAERRAAAATSNRVSHRSDETRKTDPATTATTHAQSKIAPAAAAAADESKSSQSARQQQESGGQQRRAFFRGVFDAQNEDAFPGARARFEGQDAVDDVAVNEAYDSVGAVLRFFRDVFGWLAIDDDERAGNAQVLSTVHFGKGVENAFWDPDRRSLVFGDGHSLLHSFTRCVDVVGHEMTHAIMESLCPLEYAGQSGALAEHIADVFGVMCKQYADGQTADEADWLVGDGCLLPGVRGVALRSMKNPGTAYNDPRIGKDPQPSHFKDLVVRRPAFRADGTSDISAFDAHLHSGIANRAFCLAALAFGGYSWRKAGRVWWDAVRSGQVPPRCTLLQFADVTVDKAGDLFGADAAKMVADAWKAVGVARLGHWGTFPCLVDRVRDIFSGENK